MDEKFKFARRKFEEAIAALYHKDFAIIEKQCSERSIVFRLGLYVAQNFEKCGYHVDCEYNRRGTEPKSLKGKRFNFPDVIVHQRGNSENNLLVVEVKTRNDTRSAHFQNDINKLIGFTKKGPYSYTGGIHVYISATICCLAWYQEGKVIEYQKYRIAKDNHDLLLVDANSPQNKCKFDEGYCPSR